MYLALFLEAWFGITGSDIRGLMQTLHMTNFHMELNGLAHDIGCQTLITDNTQLLAVISLLQSIYLE